VEVTKAIYGLYDSGRSWFEFLASKFRACGMTQSAWHPCIWYADGLIIGVFVDDLVVLCRDEATLREFRDKLEAAGVPTTREEEAVGHLLGMRYNYDKSAATIEFDFEEKERELVADMEGAEGRAVTPRSTPAPAGHTLGNLLPGTSGCNPLYRKFVGSLIHISKIRMEIKNSVRELCRHLERNDASHWDALLHVVGYIKHTAGTPLKLHAVQPDQCRLALWSDASWGANEQDRGSTGGYVLSLGGMTFHSSSKALQVIQRSSAEAEAFAASEAAYEGHYVIRILQDLGLTQQVCPIILDSRAAMGIVTRPMMSGRSKHLDIRRLWVRNAVDEGLLELWWAASQEELADIMTKNLGRTLFEQFRARLLNHPVLEELAMTAVSAKEGCCSTGATQLQTPGTQTELPADHWRRWATRTASSSDIDVELGRDRARQVMLAALGRVTMSEPQHRPVSVNKVFLERSAQLAE
jgi:hypothetical protein